MVANAWRAVTASAGLDYHKQHLTTANIDYHKQHLIMANIDCPIINDVLLQLMYVPIYRRAAFPAIAPIYLLFIISSM